MSTIVVGYVPRPEGREVLERAIAESRLRGAELVVLTPVADAPPEVPASDPAVLDLRQQLAESGVPHTVVPLEIGADAADTIVATAEQVDAVAIIIGVRRRSTVGKFILGSNAQRIILDASCPVMAVKTPA